MKRTAERTSIPPRNQPRDDASQRQSIPGAGAPPTPPEAPKPLPNAAQKFNTRLAEILAGKLTPEPRKNLFQPIKRWSPLEDGNSIGTLEDPIAHELFSYSMELENAARALMTPKTPDEVAGYSFELENLSQQAALVRQIFWQRVHAAFPDTFVPGHTCSVRFGWKILNTRCECAEDRLEDLASSFGAPASFLAHLLRTRMQPEDGRE